MLMFIGFDVVSGEEWGSILNKNGLKELPYVAGAAVRKLVVGTEGRYPKNIEVLTANEAPPNHSINFHHELAHAPNPPSHVNFFC